MVVESHYPKNVGIIAMEMYFPKRCVDQTEMEKFDGVSTGKYTIGLGQSRMAFVDDREDIQSVCLTVVQNLLEKYAIPYTAIGRLEVGTETIIDKSKSVKSTLMQLFAEHDNTEIEGIDTTNACYGGTNAFLNSINWIESSSWDGRYALVVAGDLAIYASGAARPTSGAGAVAVLLGKDAPIIVERGLRGTHMEHVYDFYKPDLSSEYPVVDGKFSNLCYLRAFDNCYKRYMKRLAALENIEHPSLANFDYFVFHSPYTKLVAKSFARAAYNDFVQNPDAPQYGDLQHFRSLGYEDSLSSRDLEKTFSAFVKKAYIQKVEPSLYASRQIGNMYSAAVWACLASLVNGVSSDDLQGKRVGFFSYGSGLASTMLSFRVVGSTADIASKLNLEERLKARVVCEPTEFEKVMGVREETHNLKDYEPIGSIDTIESGAYYLEKVDNKFRRFYKRKD